MLLLPIAGQEIGVAMLVHGAMVEVPVVDDDGGVDDTTMLLEDGVGATMFEGMVLEGCCELPMVILDVAGTTLLERERLTMRLDEDPGAVLLLDTTFDPKNEPSTIFDVEMAALEAGGDEDPRTILDIEKTLDTGTRTEELEPIGLIEGVELTAPAILELIQEQIP